MAAQYVEYKLNFKGSANRTAPQTKTGILLKSEEGRVTDYMPWESFGDKPIHELLENIAKGNIPSFISTGWNIKWEESNQKAFKNHQFGLSGSGVIAKLKYLGDLSKLTKDIENFDGKVRIDFNGGLKKEQFENWANSLSESIKLKIDFIEDPFSGFSYDSFSEINLAFDFEMAPSNNCGIKVFKPLRESGVTANRTIFTHTMGHPIGLLITHGVWSKTISNNEDEDYHGMLMPDIIEGYPEIFVSKGDRFIRDERVVRKIIDELNDLDWKDI